MTVVHPGSIQVVVGRIIEKILLNIEQGDLDGTAKFVRMLKAAVSVYAPDHTPIWSQVEAVPAFSWSKPDEVSAFEDEMQRFELCLLILRREGLFGYNGPPPIGDSSALLDESGEVPA